jgi:hypothetical protein
VLKYGRPQGAHATTRALPWRFQAPQGLMLGTSTAPEDLSHEAQQQAITNAITFRDRHADTDEA